MIIIHGDVIEIDVENDSRGGQRLFGIKDESCCTNPLG
jgi:hypothetical protein